MSTFEFTGEQISTLEWRHKGRCLCGKSFGQELQEDIKTAFTRI
jgi:hypothetical protein